MDKLAIIKLADGIGAHLLSDEWKLIRYKYLTMKRVLRTQMDTKIRKGEDARYLLGRIENIDEIIKATEHLSEELKTGKLDADAALTSLKIMRV